MVNVIFDGGSVEESRSEVMSTSASEAGGERKVVDNLICFSKVDLEQIIQPHEDCLIIEAGIGPNARVIKIMMDTCSSFFF